MVDTLDFDILREMDKKLAEIGGASAGHEIEKLDFSGFENAIKVAESVLQKPDADIEFYGDAISGLAKAASTLRGILKAGIEHIPVGIASKLQGFIERATEVEHKYTLRIWLKNNREDQALPGYSGAAPPSGPVDKPSFGVDDGDMEARIAKLEEFVVDARERLTKMETRLDQTATKADLTDKVGGLQVEMHKGFGEIHKGQSDLIKWVVGTALVLGAMAITIMTFVLNNAVPKAIVAPTTQQAPIIIQVPPQATGVAPGGAAPSPSKP